MSGLNNCTTCGRKPEIRGYINIFSQINNQAICNCGKSIIPYRGNSWTAEVAADMWNRANPSDCINFIAHDLAVLGVKIDISSGKLEFKQSDNCEYSESLVISKIVNAKQYERELTDFYKNRLQTEARA